ncbi:MAG TPA: response regulator [Christiangramia sp.]|nr:response regulator [Christiangramia sp.]
MKRILVIDDSEVTLMLFESIFKGFDQITLETEANSEKAMERIQIVDYDLIITDLMMPVLNGFDLITKVKTGNKRMSQIPIIACSARTDTRVVDRVKSLGAIDFIHKPLEINAVLENVLDILQITKKSA